MFDNEWELIAVEERFESNEEFWCSCGKGAWPQEFIEWTIEYRDGNGDIRHFVFNNRSGLSRQIERYVAQYITEYFKENFFYVHLKDLPLAPSANLFGSIVSANTNRHLEENQEWVRATDEYRNRLGTPDGAIRLSQLTPDNAFEMMPIRLSIHVSFSGNDSLGQSFEENVMDKIENMVEDMNRFTNNRLTARISMGYQQVINLHTGNRSYRWYYIQGERVFDISTMYFDRYIFESFIDIFWQTTPINKECK